MFHLLQVHHQVAVGQLYSLGQPCGTARVGQDRNVARGHLRDVCRQGLAQQLLEGQHSPVGRQRALVTHHYRALVIRDSGPHLRHDRQQLGDRAAGPRPGVNELAPDLLCTQKR